VPNVLIIAKEAAEIRELHSGLTRTGFNCSVTSSSSNLSENVVKQECDVLLIDTDGSSASVHTESMWEQLHELRRIRNLPAIALISSEGLGRVDSNLEIDDFVIKPWNISEVVTRTNRALKHIRNVHAKDLMKSGNLVIDISKCEVSIEGRLLALTFKEYELLKFLASNKGRVFTRDALLNEVWGYDYYGGDRTVDVHIRRLRIKLGDYANNYIQTVRNIGYKFREEAKSVG